MKRPIQLVGSLVVPSLLLQQHPTARGVEAVAFSRTSRCSGNGDSSSNSISFLSGYSTIGDMQDDMNDELERINLGGDIPEDGYLMILCPGNVFDASVEGPIVPLLDDMKFQCGSGSSSSSSSSECIIAGGETQLIVQNVAIDNNETEYGMNSVAFEGLVFEGFTKASVSLRARKVARATFDSIEWRDFDGSSVINIKSDNGKKNGMEVILNNATIHSSSGDLESARLSNYIIRNTGGTATIDSLTAKSIRVELGLVRNNEYAITTFKNSAIAGSRLTTIAAINSGHLVVENVLLENNYLVESGFHASSDSSTMEIDKLTFLGNYNDEASWVGVHARQGAEVTVQNSVFQENLNIVWGILSETTASFVESKVTVLDCRFESNSEGAGTSALIAALGLAETDVPAHMNIWRVDFIENTGFTANILALYTARISWRQTCHIGNSQLMTIFMPAATTFGEGITAENNFADENESSLACGDNLFPIYQERNGTKGCFSGASECEANCTSTGFDAQECLSDVIISQSPSSSPSFTIGPTRTNEPTQTPSIPGVPSMSPNRVPTLSPTIRDNIFVPSPTAAPVTIPGTGQPTMLPSNTPSKSPVESPSAAPSRTPPTSSPSGNPTATPGNPTAEPTTSFPSAEPTTSFPSAEPTTSFPSASPSMKPSEGPSTMPSSFPTSSPSGNPTATPGNPTGQPSTFSPSASPTEAPVDESIPSPTIKPVEVVSIRSSAQPSLAPTIGETPEPTSAPTETRWFPRRFPTTPPVVGGDVRNPDTVDRTPAPTTVPVSEKLLADDDDDDSSSRAISVLSSMVWSIAIAFSLAIWL